MDKKPIILLCDDDLVSTCTFKLRHGGVLTEEEEKALKSEIENDKSRSPRILEAIEKKLFEYKESNAYKMHWDVRVVHNGKDFEPYLNNLIQIGKTPDIILIDMHYKGSGYTEQKEKEWLEKAKTLKKELQEIKKREEDYDGVYENLGVEYLKIAKKLCPDTPRVIYTYFGLLLANDKKLEEVSNEGGQWLMKHQQEKHEHNRLIGLYNNRKVEIPQKYKNKVFFISHFGQKGSDARKHSDRIYEKVLVKLGKENKLEIVRADKTTGQYMLDDMYEHLYFSDIIIADIHSNENFNPNVMVEIGMAFAWDKCPIIIAAKKLEGKMPFDLPSDYRLIFYDDSLDDFESELYNELDTRVKQVISGTEVLKCNVVQKIKNKFNLS